MAQPTMAAIADHLGLSRQTVSIVLRDGAGPSAETRHRVLQAARELGYVPNHSARALSRTRSTQLGVTFVPVHASEPEIVESVYAAAADLGYQVVLSAQTRDRDLVTTTEELVGYRCAAILQLGSELSHARRRALAERAGVPVVLIGAGRRNESYDVVHSASGHGIAALTTHLVELGHQRPAYLHCPELPAAAERLRGFTRAVARAGLEPRIVEITGSGYTEEAGSEGARRLLAEGLPTALVAGNDQQAVGAMWVLLRAGVAVPDQVSVTGFDDTRYAHLSGVDLTTASQDTRTLGRLAVQAAVRRVDDPDLAPQVITVEPELRWRSSTSEPG